MKRNKIIILILCIILLVITFGVGYSIQVFTKNYENDNFIVEYDTTWKVLNSDNELKLEHKKSNAVLSIQCKVLDYNYIDTKLKDIINDIIYGIEQQNTEYKLINVEDSPSDIYESYSYLYEKDNEQVLVNVYKKDTKLIIVYYEADTKYYDIVLDSVDTILDSLEIISGEKVN